ncbi:MAG: preprotein translocase subunit SecE [Armatimonadota bacterium]|nr:preprotein translocase subunit SecE [Armatimonadota bacterium]MDR7452582.1 preprotein translocase subunit SecE [Armatimonadota bacterium]MDR7468203.1 preprotein translocase subunit SecE [Armatimonadota bacterium]MDR7495063.1 preprotein translocase subunit SecE [Armatimonadota bacterium]MDR7500117.1 preprotein translocase subunit SecE [Armatimonadota bacterium]
MARLTDAKVQRPMARAVPVRRGGLPVVERITRYFREVRIELAKVDWPSRQELTAMSIVVLVVLLAMALYLGLWDLLFTWIFRRLLGR